MSTVTSCSSRTSPLHHDLADRMSAAGAALIPRRQKNSLAEESRGSHHIVPLPYRWPGSPHQPGLMVYPLPDRRLLSSGQCCPSKSPHSVRQLCCNTAIAFENLTPRSCKCHFWGNYAAPGRTALPSGCGPAYTSLLAFVSMLFLHENGCWLNLLKRLSFT